MSFFCVILFLEKINYLTYYYIIGSYLFSRKVKIFMDIRCILKEEVSKKSGKPYWCLYIPDIEKTIFLEATEVKLLKLLYKLESK